MYSLILKDILLQKKMILLSCVYIIFFLFAMQGAGSAIYPTAIIAITYMLVVTSCAYDDKNKSDVMLNSLPLKRSNIVLAKYLSVLVYIAISSIAYIVTTTLVSFTGIPVKIYPASLVGLAGGLFSISLIISVYFPFYFKLGYIKSRFINLILFFTFFFGLTSLGNYIYRNREIVWTQNTGNFLQSQTNIQLAALIGCLTLVVLLISYTLSLKAYQGRDF